MRTDETIRKAFELYKTNNAPQAPLTTGMLLRRSIGETLRTRRQAQHRTLVEVSTTAGISTAHLSDVERGQKGISTDLLSSVCDVLNIRLSEVLQEIANRMAQFE